MCDKCRWGQPRYSEQPRGGLWLVSASLQEAGLAGPVEGAMHADRRQAKLLAAEVSRITAAWPPLLWPGSFFGVLLGRG